MKTLLDHNLPSQLEPLLGNMVFTARDMRWDDLENGDLLFAAESAGFDIMITGDQNLTYEQNKLETNYLVDRNHPNEARNRHVSLCKDQ